MFDRINISLDPIKSVPLNPGVRGMDSFRDTLRIYTQGKELASLIEDHAEWSQATFGNDLIRGPVGPAEHLKKEASELLESLLEGNTVHAMEEASDVLLLLFDIVRRSGHSFDHLIEVAKRKMLVNKSRQWNTTDVNSPCEHKR